jgi:PAS domain S-box-containing protein
MKWVRSLDRWAVLGLILIVAVLLVNAGIAYHDTRQLYDYGHLVAHTDEVLDALDELLSTMKDAETGQRGFVITGEEAYLQPYENAVASAGGKLEKIKALTSDDDRQQARIPRLETLMRDKLDELALTVALRKREGFDAAQKEVLSHRGKRRMDALRGMVTEMEEDEQRLLQSRQITNHRAYIDALVNSGIIALLGLGAAIGFFWLLRRHLRSQAQAAAVLYEQREWFRTTLGSIGDAVIATDTRSRVTFLNPVAESLTGWKQETGVGVPLSSVFKIINEQSRKPVEDPTELVLREGITVGLANHTVLIARDGSERPIGDSAAPIRDVEGRVVGVVLVFRDVTERRRSELALLEADRRKDDFLAVLSHELRNPLAPLQMAVTILRQIGPPQPELRELRDVIERQTAQMSRLLEDLLDVSRIASGKIVLKKERVSLGLAVAGAVESARGLMESQGHHLIVKLPAEPIYLEGDLTRLAQVFTNLLNNAAKYTEKGGSISVTAEQADSQVEVRVRDSGIGIPPEELTRVFEMFVQLDQSPNRTRGGLGIGLSLVRRLVELHGGQIEARSGGPGRGSEFIVRLPALKPTGEGSPPAADSEDAPDASRCRILVADDSVDTAELLARVLRFRGHEVRTAHDGPGALAETTAFQPDVAVLDIGMPGLSGYEVAREIRSRFGDHIVLVAVTGWGQEEDKRRAREYGFDHHLTKPIDSAALQRLLREVSPAARSTA